MVRNLLLALLLAGCQATPGGLLAGDFMSQPAAHNPGTNPVHNPMSWINVCDDSNTPVAIFPQHLPAITLYPSQGCLPVSYNDQGHLKLMVSNMPWQPEVTCYLLDGKLVQGSNTACSATNDRLDYNTYVPK